MRTSTSLRVVAFLLSGILAPLFLTQCKTTAKSYKDVSYDPSKLKTPAGHGMERNDYPFDEQGSYRKDWVKSNTSGRDRSAQPGQETVTEVASTTPEGTETVKPGSTSYPTFAEASAARSSGNFVGPAGASSELAGTAAGTMTTTLASAGGEGSEVVLASAPSASETTSSPAAASYHKVTSGETLFALASRYNTSVPDLKRVNGLTGDSIRVGQSLRIP